MNQGIDILFSREAVYRTDVRRFKRILDVYPDENLQAEPEFAKTLRKLSISLPKLQKASKKLLINWRLFMLSEANLNKALSSIEARHARFTQYMQIANRGNSDNSVSYRLLDRISMIQLLMNEHNPNLPCNSLIGRLQDLENHPDELADAVIEEFNIDLAQFRRQGKTEALEYLINKVENMGFGVVRAPYSSTHHIFPPRPDVP